MTLQGTGGQGPAKSRLPEGHSLEAGEPHIEGKAWLPSPAVMAGMLQADCKFLEGNLSGRPLLFHPAMPQGMALTLANLREDSAPSGKEPTAPRPRPLAWVGLVDSFLLSTRQRTVSGPPWTH